MTPSPSDPRLTADNVNDIMEMVENPASLEERSVADSLGVPPAMVVRILRTENNPGQAVGEYWKKTVPGASWKMMAHALYQNNEQRAMKGVEKFVKINENKG